jgi:hypothetical protein
MGSKLPGSGRTQRRDLAQASCPRCWHGSTRSNSGQAAEQRHHEAAVRARGVRPGVVQRAEAAPRLGHGRPPKRRRGVPPSFSTTSPPAGGSCRSRWQGRQRFAMGVDRLLKLARPALPLPQRPERNAKIYLHRRTIRPERRPPLAPIEAHPNEVSYSTLACIALICQPRASGRTS